jgi:hypothetical protein
MRQRLTILLLFLSFIGCKENEEDKLPSPGIGMKKTPFVSSQSKSGQKEGTASLQETPPPGSVLIHRRKITRKEKLTLQPKEPTENRIVDSTLINKLIYLSKANLEIDLREPVNRAYFFSPVENPEFSSMILLSHDRSVRINFDNDILDGTDRYYTNGIRFDFISPSLKQSPLSWCMVPYWGHGVNYYGISIGQNMYTPYTTKVGGIHQGDRPYAAYLFLGSFKISNDPEKKFRQTSEIDLGVIGPSSFGDFVQKSFHSSVPTNNEPLGWEYQIRNDLVLNYNLTYEKGLLSNRGIEFNLNALGDLGTLYTNMGGGFQFRTGRMNPYFDSYGFSGGKVNKAKGYSKFQAFFFITSLGKLVGYDATLEGGMFNKSSIYTLTSKEISLLTYQGTLGLTLAYAGLRLDVEQFLLSPEFHGGSWHKWVHIGVTIGM